MLWNCWMREGAACQPPDSIPPSPKVTHYQGEAAPLYIFVWDVLPGDRRVEIGHAGVIGCSSLCPHNIDMRHLLLLWFGRTVKGGELKEQTRRRQPLTDLTSVIGALRCQHASQIKTNGAYPGYWRLASLGPISSAPVNVHRERLIEHPTVPSRRTHRRIQIGSRATGRGGVITGAAGLGGQVAAPRQEPPHW